MKKLRISYQNYFVSFLLYILPIYIFYMCFKYEKRIRTLYEIRNLNILYFVYEFRIFRTKFKSKICFLRFFKCKTNNNLIYISILIFFIKYNKKFVKLW